MLKFRVLIIFFSSLLFSISAYSAKSEQPLHDWIQNKVEILQPAKKKSSRTAILIIEPPTINPNYYTEARWALGKEIWKKYMNSVSSVDCYFIKSVRPKIAGKQEIWLEENTIFVGDPWYEERGNDRILHKTIMALEFLLPKYTHYVRTNLNTFMNLKAVKEYTKTHYQSMYTGPIWEKNWYVYGYGILFSKDVAAHMVKEYRRLEGEECVDCYHADDCQLTSLATGINPCATDKNTFRCCPTLPRGIRQTMCKETDTIPRISRYGIYLLPPITLDEAIQYCELAPKTAMLYRIREGMTLDELSQLYNYLVNKIYPEL